MTDSNNPVKLPFESPRFPLYFHRTSFPRKSSEHPKMAQNRSYSPSPTTAVRHRFCKSTPLTRLSRPPLPRYRLSFPRHSPEFDENGFEPLDSSSSDLLRPPLDGGDFEIYCPWQLGLHFDHWDSPSATPVTGNLNGQKMVSMEDE